MSDYDDDKYTNDIEDDDNDNIDDENAEAYNIDDEDISDEDEIIEDGIIEDDYIDNELVDEIIDEDEDEDDDDDEDEDEDELVDENSIDSKKSKKNKKQINIKKYNEDDDENDENDEDDEEEEDDDDENNIIIDNDDISKIIANKSNIKIEYIVKPENRITSQYITLFELSQVVGKRATQISNGSKIYVNYKNLTNAIDIAKKEILEKKCPLAILRGIGLDKYECWNVNELMIKYNI